MITDGFKHLFYLLTCNQTTNKVKAQSFLVLNISATDAAQSFVGVSLCL